ncbi:MAG: 4Fe-4S binding protein [Candidatus Thorarchaeota archaeon]
MRNLSKELASSDFVREFSESYFSRNVPKGPDVHSNRQSRIDQPYTPDERRRADVRYKHFLHHQVVTTEEMLDVIQLSSYQTDDHERAVVRLPCICRYRSYGGESKLLCLGIAFTDQYTRRFPSYLGGKHEYISCSEAVEFVKTLAIEEPIVHAVSALGVPYVGMICNCDMEVCRPFITRSRLGITSPFYKGHYVGQIDERKCSGCGTCEELCPFGAAKLSEEGSISSISLDKCYGCGICERNCQDGAITLVFRQEGTGF